MQCSYCSIAQFQTEFKATETLIHNEHLCKGTQIRKNRTVSEVKNRTVSIKMKLVLKKPDDSKNQSFGSSITQRCKSL